MDEQRASRQLHRYRSRIAALTREVEDLRRAPIHPRILFRPLITSGCIGKGDAGAVYILIDSEQPEAEQLVALWHETLHLLGLKDEALVEAMAQQLAAACPEILGKVKEINDVA